jgi:hypothetical protein
MASVPLISDDILSFATRIGVTNSQEINWMMEILLSQRSRTMPFYDLIGGIGAAKPIMEVMDFKKTKGKEIVITLDRALGYSGTQGAATANRLLDNIEDPLHATYTATVGVMAHAVGGEQIMKTQTVIGSNWDKRNKQKLKEWHANKKAEEIQWEMIKRAHARNSLFPNGKTTRDSLTSADTINLSTITRGKEMLAALQAKPCAVGKTKAGAEILKYFWLTHNYALSGMEESPGYLNLLANAGVRGDANYIFAGGQPEFGGNLIHSWNIEDGDHIGALAAPVAPRQYLGVEFPANATASGDLTGVFVQAHATDAVAPFFQYFPAAACVGHEGTKIAATTTTTHVLGIKILTGAEAGKIALISYKVNDGNKITPFERLGASASNDVVTTLTGTSITYGEGAWTANTVAVGAIPVGSLIIPVNYKGQPWVTSFALGQNAILSGYGSLDVNGAEVPGQRLVEAQDFGRLFALGYQDVWGCRATENANNVVNGYIKVESAYNPDGWPTIE